MAASTNLVMGVDGGGSHTTAWLANVAGEVLGKGQAGASNRQSVGEAAARAALQEAMQQALAQAGLSSSKPEVLCLGLAGSGRDERWLFRDWAEKAALAERVVVVNDADLLLWAVTPDGWGLGLICGTGSIAVGKTRQGRTARAGGWGYLIGDEGSGYALGLAALRAAVRAADGRIPPTRLQADVLAALQLERVEQLVPLLYQRHPGRGVIGRLAEVVFTAADCGDVQARQLVRQAAAELAKSALAVCSQLGWPSDPSENIPCALGGGVFLHQPQFARQVVGRLRRAGLLLEPLQSVPEPVAGAVRLALREKAARDSSP